MSSLFPRKQSFSLQNDLQKSAINHITNSFSNMNNSNLSLDETQRSTFLQHRIKHYQLRNYDMLQFQELKHAIYQDNIDAIYYGIIGFRKLLREQAIEYTTDLYFNSGIVPKFIEYAAQIEHLELKKQSFHIISNLALGTQQHAQLLVKMGIIKLFLEGITSTNHEIVQFCLLGVGHLIIDNSRIRDQFIENNIVNYLLQKIQKRPSNNIANMSIITVCNLILVKPYKIQIENIQTIIAYFCWYMKQSENQERDQSIILALIHLTHNNQSMVKLITQSGIYSNLVTIVKHCHSELKYPTLKIIAIILSHYTPETLKQIISSKIVFMLEEQVDNERQNVRSEVYQICGILGSNKQTQTLIYSSQILMNKFYSSLIKKSQTQQNFRYIGNVLMCPLFNNKTYNDSQKFTSAAFYREMNILKIMIEYIQVFKSSYCRADCLSWIQMLLIAGKNYSRVGVWVENEQFLQNHGDKIINDLEKDTTNEGIKKLIKNIRLVRQYK